MQTQVAEKNLGKQAEMSTRDPFSELQLLFSHTPTLSTQTAGSWPADSHGWPADSHTTTTATIIIQLRASPRSPKVHWKRASGYSASTFRLSRERCRTMSR